jgi:hypothetical protein
LSLAVSEAISDNANTKSSDESFVGYSIIVTLPTSSNPWDSLIKLSKFYLSSLFITSPSFFNNPIKFLQFLAIIFLFLYPFNSDLSAIIELI